MRHRSADRISNYFDLLQMSKGLARSSLYLQDKRSDGFRLGEAKVKDNVLKLAAVGLLIGSAGAQAGPVFYTDLASFSAASTTTLVEDFNGPGLTYDVALASFSSNGITYTGLGGVPFPNVYLASGSINTAGGSTILAGNGQEDFRLDFDAGVSAIGLDTYDNNLGGITVSIFDESGGILGSILQDHAEHQVGFLGMVSDVNIGSLRWTGTSGGIVNTGLDNVRLGTIVSVPEPTTLVLLVLGLAGMGLRRLQIH